jgi:hypothetical protein
MQTMAIPYLKSVSDLEEVAWGETGTIAVLARRLSKKGAGSVTRKTNQKSS